MKKFKTWFIWIFVNLCGTYLIMLAVLENNEIASNIVKFASHLILFASIILYAAIANDQDKQEEFLKKERVPWKVEASYDLFVALFFAAMGWFYYAAIWIIAMLFTAAISQPTKTKCRCGSGKLYSECCFGKKIDKTKLYSYRGEN